MNHDPGADGYFATFAATVAGFLREWLTDLGGPTLRATAFCSVTWGDLVVVATLVLSTLLVNLLLAWLLRRRSRGSAEQGVVDALGDDSLRVVGKPVYFLPWIYCLYFAAAPLLLRIGQDGAWRPLCSLLDKLLDLAFVAVPLRLFFRFTHVLEAWMKQWVSNTSSKIDDLLPPLLGKSLRIIKADPLWDKRFWNLQVTETSERRMQIRVLATAADSSKAWDLRCRIREKLISHLQEHHPQNLPKLRAELGVPGPRTGGESGAPAPSRPSVVAG